MGLWNLFNLGDIEFFKEYLIMVWVDLDLCDDGNTHCDTLVCYNFHSLCNDRVLPWGRRNTA